MSVSWVNQMIKLSMLERVLLLYEKTVYKSLDLAAGINLCHFPGMIPHCADQLRSTHLSLVEPLDTLIIISSSLYRLCHPSTCTSLQTCTCYNKLWDRNRVLFSNVYLINFERMPALSLTFTVVLVWWIDVVIKRGSVKLPCCAGSQLVMCVGSISKLTLAIVALWLKSPSQRNQNHQLAFRDYTERRWGFA